MKKTSISISTSMVMGMIFMSIDMRMIMRQIPRGCRSGQVVLWMEMHRRQRLGMAHLKIKMKQDT